LLQRRRSRCVTPRRIAVKPVPERRSSAKSLEVR
jgi:hypothetical protein